MTFKIIRNWIFFLIIEIVFFLPVSVYNKPPVLVSYNRTFVSLAVDAKYRSLLEIANARMRPLIQKIFIHFSRIVEQTCFFLNFKC
jgi:hypothetical protein